MDAKLEEVVAAKALEQTVQHLADVQSQLSQGRASDADVLGVRAEAASAELGARAATDAVVVAERVLRTFLHDDSRAIGGVGEDVRAEPPALALAPTPSLVVEALAQRLELRSASEATRSFEAATKVARSAAYPRLDLVGEAIDANPNPRYIPPDGQFHPTWDVGVQVAWSPNDTGAGLSAAAAARARARDMRLRESKLRDELTNEVTRTRESYADALEALSSTRHALTAAEESYRVRRLLFQYGRATSTELTDTETQLTQARARAVDALVRVRAARVEVLYTLGRPIG